MIVIQKPKKSAYVGSEEVLEILDKLNATDQDYISRGKTEEL